MKKEFEGLPFSDAEREHLGFIMPLNNLKANGKILSVTDFGCAIEIRFADSVDIEKLVVGISRMTPDSIRIEKDESSQKITFIR